MWKVSRQEVFSGPYFPVFGPEKTPYWDTVHALVRGQAAFGSYGKLQNSNCETNWYDQYINFIYNGPEKICYWKIKSWLGRDSAC